MRLQRVLTEKQRERQRKYEQAWRKRNAKWTKEHDRWRHTKKKYGLTKEDYAELVKSHKSCCAVCGALCTSMLEDRRATLHVDHCHTTGRVRGLLCGPCNGKLGWYEKNKKKVEAYLEGSV